MALVSAGAISLAEVNVELGRSASTTISMNDSNVRTLAQIGSGTISMSNFYGKSNCPASGTFLTTYCSGCNYYYRYANGSCGSYDSLIESNSQSCGCCPAYGQYHSQYCSGCTLYYRYHNGSCGLYEQVAEYNSQSCGCCPGYGGLAYFWCSGCTRYARYHDGGCGYYDQVYEYNSGACGCCPGYGTLYSTWCSGCDLYYRYHNGGCGYYDEYVQGNSPSCGCGAVDACQSCSGASYVSGCESRYVCGSCGFGGWGCCGYYTSDSNWGNVAVQMGIIAPGQCTYVTVCELGCGNGFSAQDANCVQTNGWGSWCAVSCC
ncbi:MAG: hypothetical protein FGM36_14710 [Burkholderiaceae bacterium]|jgi:hypothetical protein|nr:hypothetical protein [Burkholderiaceae bacterium]